jgi:tetratricopeptide (TPR) repeat protein
MDFNHRLFVKKAYVGLSEIADLQGNPVRSVKNYERGLEYCDTAALKNNLGNAYSALGDFRKAIALNREYLKISERIGDREGIATAAEAVG